MDIKSMLSTVVSQDSVKQISRSVKVPEKDVQSVLLSAIPALLGGALLYAAITYLAYRKACADFEKIDL